MDDVLDRPQQLDTTPSERQFDESRWSILPTVRFAPVSVEDDRTTPHLVDEEVVLSFQLDSSGLASMLRQIADLTTGDESDEYGVLRPTEYTLLRTMEVLMRAFKASIENRCPFPCGAVITDERGGLRIEWSDEDAAVCLVIAAEERGQSYIYHERGNDYGTTSRVSGSLLASWLHRLLVK